MSTNKPSIGSAVCELASVVLRKFQKKKKNQLMCTDIVVGMQRIN